MIELVVLLDYQKPRLMPSRHAHTRATTFANRLSVVLGAIVLNEELNFRVIAGMVVVLVSVGMTRWRKQTPSPLVTEDPTTVAANN